MTFQTGQRILNGKYRILKLIKEGGMARVWLAEELTFGGRRVAIKEPRANLLPEVAQEVRQRYHQEVQVCAALEQARAPNIVRAITAEPCGDSLLLVLEYTPRGDLAALLKQYPDGLPVERAVSIAQDVLRALEGVHAHDMEIVHRDIKPSNILFDNRGQAHLADFGLAQLAGTSGRSQLRGGQHPGTPAYSSPEQLVSPDPLSPSSDLYALGCVLFEMLTGERYRRHQAGIRASALRPIVPTWLDSVLAKALAEAPWERWQSAAQFREALTAGPRAGEVGAPAAPGEAPPQIQPAAQQPKARPQKATAGCLTGIEDWAIAILELISEIASLFIALISFFRPGVLWPPEMTDTLIEVVGLLTAAIAVAIPARRAIAALRARRGRAVPPQEVPARAVTYDQNLQILALVAISGFVVIVLFFGYLAFLSQGPAPGRATGAIGMTSSTAFSTQPTRPTPAGASPVTAANTQTPTPSLTFRPTTYATAPARPSPNTVSPTPEPATSTLRPPTPTTKAPTSTPTRTPPTLTLTRTAMATPTPSPSSSGHPAPTLIKPDDGASVGDFFAMQWQWDGTLQDSEWFDVRVWKAGEPHYGIAWVRELEYQADFRGRAGGEYLWAVAVIRGRDGQMDGELSPESATRRFIYGGGGGGSSGGEEGDGGTSPTAPIVTPPG